jgi:hypothetical protein
MPGCSSVPSVDVTVSPECNVLITVTSLQYLYVRIEYAVRSLDFHKSKKAKNPSLRYSKSGACFELPCTSGLDRHFGCVNCCPNAKCQDKQIGEMLTRPMPDIFA